MKKDSGGENGKDGMKITTKREKREKEREYRLYKWLLTLGRRKHSFILRLHFIERVESKNKVLRVVVLFSSKSECVE